MWHGTDSVSDKGFIVLKRQIDQWQWWDVPNAVSLWLHILIDANWADAYWHGISVPRGSFITSIGKLAAECNMSMNTVRHWLEQFEQAGQITRRSTNKYTHIFVVNYAKYQDCFTASAQQTAQQVEHQTEHQTAHNRTIKTRITRKTNIERFTKPTLEQVETYIKEQGFTVDAQRFVDYYESNGWTINGKAKMKDWQATVRNWQRREKPQKVMPEYANKPIEAASSEDIASVNTMIERMRNGRKNQTC